MEIELRESIKFFETKMKKLQEEYKKKNFENFSEAKMERYVNRKMKKDIRFLVGVNLFVPTLIIKDTKRFKY